jgi:lambda family phage portal protein
MAGFLDRIRGAFAPPAVAAPGRPAARASYMRGDAGPVFANWFPPLRDSREDVRASYTRAAARTIDSIQNSGWLAGAVRQSVASTIGTGLRLAAKPDPRCFGGDQVASAQWARDVERDFEAWAGDPLEVDAAGKSNLAQLSGAALRSDFAYGETVGLVQWIERSCSRTATKLKLLPAHRLVQESNSTDLFQGVRVDRDGLPVAYRLMLDDPYLLPNGIPVEIEARDGAGRPRVMHIFDADVGQMRGISLMTPVLKVVRQFDQLSDATLTAALIQAIFAATVKAPAPTQDILQALQSDSEQAATQGLNGAGIDCYIDASSGWYENAKLDLYGFGNLGKIAHMFPGEELDFKRSEHPNDTYEAFAKFLLREIAVCLGLAYETVTGDYAGATYSSVRMRTSEVWPMILVRRLRVAAPLYQYAYQAWLEEMIDRDRIGFPGGLDAFIAQRTHVCRADWRGPARPQADDLKYAKAVEVLMNLGLITAEEAYAERGLDWEDGFEQQKREQDMRKRLDLPPPLVSTRDTNTGDQEKEAA